MLINVIQLKHACVLYKLVRGKVFLAFASERARCPVKGLKLPADRNGNYCRTDIDGLM